ncbi:MAG TPA: M20/M25/M40 family metallo-hydrolase [Bacteroidales bacterium]|nr:M20/M25/M40 family metallo-hydrolase [Bacteroidales bacterium]
MKKTRFITAIFLLITLQTSIYSQKKPEDRITASELETHVTFLASPLLRGRLNGAPELGIAAEYIASQAKLIGLRPANGDSYFQTYPVLQTKMDLQKSGVKVSSPGDTLTLIDPVYNLNPQGPANLDLEGEVVFAGYGIKTNEYNDLEGLDIKGKIVIVMDGGPMKDNQPFLAEKSYYSKSGFQMKLGALMSPGPKAVLFVPAPSSGYKSFADEMPGLAGYLSTKTVLKGSKDLTSGLMSLMPKIMFINRSVADAVLAGGKDLNALQKEINETSKPKSFQVGGKKLRIIQNALNEEKTLSNVAGYIEGSDPVLKNEIVVFSAHYDHIGDEGGAIHAGADDDASGCAALLAMADALQNMKKKPLRSVMFLWVSGEEIGLFGSQTYVEHPLFPLEKTVADLNMDMIGRVKETADSTKETPMTGPNNVFVIACNQSKELMNIAAEIDKKNVIDFDYSLSGRDHPLQLFARSDHFNFVKHDIPVLFFTTGLHSDYHTPGDVIAKIDFNKMQLVTRTMFEIGLEVAGRKSRLVVDNPYSSWGKSK